MTLTIMHSISVLLVPCLAYLRVCHSSAPFAAHPSLAAQVTHTTEIRTILSPSLPRTSHKPSHPTFHALYRYIKWENPHASGILIFEKDIELYSKSIYIACILRLHGTAVSLLGGRMDWILWVGDFVAWVVLVFVKEQKESVDMDK
jgi:hypothetical protein